VADLARGVLIAAVVLEAGVVIFLRAVRAPALRDGAAELGGRALRRLLLVVALVTAVAAAVGLAAGPGHGREQAGWLLAAVAAVVVVALVLASAPDGSGLAGWSPRALALAAAAGLLLGVPALLGNAGVADAWLVVPANVLHVAAAAAWTGGIACLLVLCAVPAPPADRTRLLATVVGRFSAIALLAVLAIAFSGLLEGLVLVRRVDALVTTGYGRLVAIKALLLCALAALGAVQRGRTLPELHDAATGTGDPAAAARLLRTVLRAEATLLGLVLLASGVLATMTPSRSDAGRAVTRDLRAGPFALTARVTPASPGDNRITVSIRRDAGAAQVARVLLSERQPKLGIGPLRQTATRSGPGRFAVAAAPLGAPGTWSFTVTVVPVGSGPRRSGTFTARLR
jgi:copper transport protein